MFMINFEVTNVPIVFGFMSSLQRFTACFWMVGEMLTPHLTQLFQQICNTNTGEKALQQNCNTNRGKKHSHKIVTRTDQIRFLLVPTFGGAVQSATIETYFWNLTLHGFSIISLCYSHDANMIGLRRCNQCHILNVGELNFKFKFCILYLPSKIEC